MPRFALEPVTESCFDPSSPNYHRFEVLSSLSPRVLWSELHSATPLTWCTGIRSATWTSERPFGVGTTRTVRLATGVTLSERYFAWSEEGGTRVNAFSVERANVPVLRSFAERYTVRPTGDGSHFTWEFSIEPRLPRVLHPLLRPLVARDIEAMRRDTLAHFGTTARPTAARPTTARPATPA